MTRRHRNDLDWQSLAEVGRLPVFLTRHGQTEWNVQRRFLGRSDVPLDDLGHEQAGRLAERLAPIPITAIYTSPLSRARQTAEAIGLIHPSVAITSIPNLMELSQGDLEGQPGASLPERYPEFFARWTADPADARVPGGETLRECQERAVTALTSICEASSTGGSIVVVTHQMVLSCLVCAILGWPLARYHEVKQGNTALNLVSWGDDGFAVHWLNDVTHLG